MTTPHEQPHHAHAAGEHAAPAPWVRAFSRGPVVTAVVLLVVAAIAWYVLYKRTPLTIGVEGRMSVEIPGPRLVATPYTVGDAVSVRIAEVIPTGRGFRYDLRYMAFGPGKHDLSKHLMPAGDATPETLPPLTISMGSILPTDHQGELFDNAPSAIDLHSKYQLWLSLSWLAWGALLLPLLLLGRKRAVHIPPPPRVPTLAERLEKILATASRGGLSVAQQADLESLLMEYWSQRLNLSAERLPQTLKELKKHPTAGRQIALVEKWLHSPARLADAASAKELWRELAPDLHPNTAAPRSRSS